VYYQRLSARTVKLLTIVSLIWLAPAILVLLAMAWSLRPRKTSREELLTERPVLLDATISASKQKRDDQQDEQPGHDDECKDDLKSLAER
jgi:hypothetical protein